MTSLFKRTPKIKDNITTLRVFVPIISFICTIFILSPVLVCFITKQNPLTEMPDNVWYIIFRGLFGISLLLSSIIFSIYKTLNITILPALTGFIASLFPLFYRINRYKEYKSIIKRNMMTADYTPYLVNIGIYILFTLLCVFYIMYIFGLFRIGISVLVLSALSVTAVLFLTIDKGKTLEYSIFSIYDILCFAYGMLACSLPALIVFSSERNTANTTITNTGRQQKYVPRRMK